MLAMEEMFREAEKAGCVSSSACHLQGGHVSWRALWGPQGHRTFSLS